MEEPPAPGFLYLGPQAQTTTAKHNGPTLVTIHVQALWSILDHSIRRNPGQDRVIGTLLGTRSEDGNELEIRNSFGVPHSESLDQVEVDMEYQKNMLLLHLRANPREVLIGWYATSLELNTFSALIQNFYASPPDGTYPFPAIHLAVSVTPGLSFACNTYMSSNVGIRAERVAESCLFVPIPHEIQYGDAERIGRRFNCEKETNISVDFVSKDSVSTSNSRDFQGDIRTLEDSIKSIINMLDTTLALVIKITVGY